MLLYAALYNPYVTTGRLCIDSLYMAVLLEVIPYDTTVVLP